jgi:Tfp pilus assembly PilM family ATPase
MSAFRTLPLGIDIGTTRARIAVAESSRDGGGRFRAIVSRDLPEGSSSSSGISDPEIVAIVLEEMLDELGVRERRCVAALSMPSAVLRLVRFPKMSWAERTRAAAFEAQRFVPWDMSLERSQVRVHASGRSDGLYAVGVTRADAAETRLRALRTARLKPVSIDHDGFALHRMLPHYDAILDIGFERAILHVADERAPRSWNAPAGGVDITRGIALDLAIDEASAERRKRILGAAGAGREAHAGVVARIASMIERARSRTPIARIAAVGNGARVPGLAADIESAAGTIVEMPVADMLQTADYPEDVVRAAAPDWTLAAGLALWANAA